LQTPIPSRDEPTADVLARAEGWARSGRIEEALALCQAVMPRLVGQADAVALGTCEHIMSLSQAYAGRNKESVLAGYRAIGFLEGTPAVERLLQVLSLQASGIARLGVATEALELLDRAIRLLPSLEERPRDKCVFWTNAATVHHALGQLPQAQEAAEQALALAAQFEDANLAIVCEANALTVRVALLGRSLPTARAELVQALERLEHFTEVCIAEGRHHLVPDCAESAADGFAQLGDSARARKWLHRGIDSTRHTGARPSEGQLELGLARLDRLDGAFESATAHLALALEQLDEGQAHEALAAVHLEASVLKEAQEDWRGSLASFKRHAELREASLRAQADTRTQAMAMRLDLERSRLESELLRRRNEELLHSMTQLSDEAGVFKRQAMEDPLTGLANRRQLDSGVAQLALQFPDTPLTLLIADIDHFKRINDTWSHATGDEVLKAFARVLHAQSRPQDVLARIGGEEFVVVLGGPVSTTRAMLVAERFRAAIEEYDWSALQPGMVVTASIGVAACAPGESLNAALNRADAALYECKRRGRNQVRCSG
jgi:diguanylate cyclase